MLSNGKDVKKKKKKNYYRQVILRKKLQEKTHELSILNQCEDFFNREFKKMILIENWMREAQFYVFLLYLLLVLPST